jgi:glycosyltransferase involved in cell wall biosynthesis
VDDSAVAGEVIETREHGNRVDGVVVIGPTPPPHHGVSVMTQRLVDSLREMGRLAAHLDTRDPRPWTSIGRLDPTNLWLGLRHWVQLVALCLRHRRATVYVPVSQGRWGFLRDAVFLITARLFRRPRIVHLHGGYFSAFRAESGPMVRLAMRFALGGVEQAWVLTDGLRRSFGKLVPENRVRVVENCVEDPGPTEFATTPRGGSRAGPLRILYLSNLVPEKGSLDLIEALRRGRSPLETPVVVRFVGGAPPEVAEELRRRAEQVARSGVEVELPGARTGEAKLDEYRCADVFAYPTRYPYEGQPLVILEAMASGLPIVTSAQGGIAETVEDGRSAVVVRPGDVDALATAIARLVGDANLRAELGAEARKAYLARYTPERFAARVGELLG